MGWTTADPNTCCHNPYNDMGDVRFEGNTIFAYATCRTCGAESRDAFLDSYVDDYDFSRVPSDWTADTDHCAPDTGGEGAVAAHNWSDWSFNHKGNRVKAERTCQRCRTQYTHTYVYRYTEYDTDTLPEFTEGDHVAYHPDTDVDPADHGAAADIVAVDYDTGEYTLEIVDPMFDDLTTTYGLSEGVTVTTTAGHLADLDV